MRRAGSGGGCAGQRRVIADSAQASNSTLTLATSGAGEAAAETSSTAATSARVHQEDGMLRVGLGSWARGQTG